MELVIDIPEDLYQKIKNSYVIRGGRGNGKMITSTLLSVIYNGTPLPKGHRRLIDADYEIATDGRTVDDVCGYLAPTIIEAESEEEE